MIQRIVARYLKLGGLGNLLPRLQKVFLLLQRKRNLSNSMLPDIIAVLKADGWDISQKVELRQLSKKPIEIFFSRNPGEPVSAGRNHYAEAEQKKGMPSNPEVGKLYVKSLSLLKMQQLKKGDMAGSVRVMQDHDLYSFTYDPYVGVNVTTFTSPENKTFVLEPSLRDAKISAEYSVKDPNDDIKYNIKPLLNWLYTETSLVERADKAAPRDTSHMRTKENTGTCPVCFRNVKLSSSKRIVLHGYKRPGWGQLEGECPGFRYPPFEISNEGTKHYLVSLVRYEKGLEKGLHDWKAGVYKEIKVRHQNETVKEGDPFWKHYLEVQISQIAYDLKTIQAEVTKYQTLINGWEPKPLPH